MTIKTKAAAYVAKPAVEIINFPSAALSIGSYRLVFRAREPITLPAYAGSAWRGLFGHALKQAVCVTHAPVCMDCLLYRSCPYSYIFETPTPADTDRMTRYPAAPHPFVIYPLPVNDRSVPEGTDMIVELTVFGRANGYLPYLAHAFQRAGQRGIGGHQGKFELLRMEQNTGNRENWRPIWDTGGQLAQLPSFLPEPPECPAAAVIELQSPLRLKREERLVGPQEFAFHDLLRSLLRRIAMLMYFHEQKPFDADFAEMAEAARHIGLINKNVHWQDWTRYSSRQKTAMQMGGLVGNFELSGDEARPFWPLLWLGQWTHAGKGASMGLGRYRIHDAKSLPAQPVSQT
jgi:CRISPR/Cas system endoribonuclease Cas6 (RAMP superfamily)